MALAYCSPITGNIDAYTCGMRRGGLKGEIYVANFGDIDEITSATASNVYNAVTMNIDPATTTAFPWYRIAFRKDTAGMTNEMVNGTNNKYINQTISFSIDGLTPESHAVLNEIAEGQAVFIVKDYEGQIHLLGRVAGLEVSEMSSGTGTAADDLYGAMLTFTSEEPELSNFIAVNTTIEVSDGLGGTVTVTL